MSEPRDLLLAALDLEARGEGRFRAGSVPGWSARIFGGQFLAQAVIAAGRTVESTAGRTVEGAGGRAVEGAGQRAVDTRAARYGGKVVHSLHGYFIRPGDPGAPLDYAVAAVRDGRSFATRRVEASQDGSLRFVALVSLVAPEDGLEYAPVRHLAPVPGPDGLPSYGEWLAGTTDDPERHYETRARPRPVEVRYVDPPANPPAGPVTAPQRMWLRVPGPLPDDPLVHAAALAYASDETLIDNSMLPHGRRWSDPDLQGASLDHAMWFLRPVRADRWLLFEQTVVSTSAGRALARGDLFTADGIPVATATQEGLIRLNPR